LRSNSSWLRPCPAAGLALHELLPVDLLLDEIGNRIAAIAESGAVALVGRHPGNGWLPAFGTKALQFHLPLFLLVEHPQKLLGGPVGRTMTRRFRSAFGHAALSCGCGLALGWQNEKDARLAHATTA